MVVWRASTAAGPGQALDPIHSHCHSRTPWGREWSVEGWALGQQDLGKRLISYLKVPRLDYFAFRFSEP